MKLTHPRSHKVDDLVPLYEKFREENRDVYQEWFNRVFKLNTRPYDLTAVDRPDPTITRIYRKLEDFILVEVECENSIALCYALMDFGKLMRREVAQQIIQTRGEE